jgi:hypothetical protein
VAPDSAPHPVPLPVAVAVAGIGLAGVAGIGALVRWRRRKR